MLLSIQACRAAAALLVVFFHAAGNLAKPQYFGTAAAGLEKFFWSGGDAGVAFFFVLSGFIIARAHHDDIGRPSRLGAYVVRRVSRIYPPYLLVFAAVCAAGLVVPSLRDALPDDPWTVLAALTLFPLDREAVGGTGAPVLFVAWTLQFEMLFYASFALAIVRRWLFGLAVIAFVMGQWLAGGAEYRYPHSFLTSHLIWLFLFGMAAYGATCRGVLRRHAGSLAFVATLAFVSLCLLASASRDGHSKPVFDLMLGAASAFMVLGLAQWEQRSGARGLPAISGLLGDASYVLYLVHVPFISLVSKLTTRWLPPTIPGAAAAFLIAVAGSLLVAIVLHRLVERPLLKRIQYGRAASAGDRSAAGEDAFRGRSPI